METWEFCEEMVVESSPFHGIYPNCFCAPGLQFCILIIIALLYLNLFTATLRNSTTIFLKAIFKCF